VLDCHREAVQRYPLAGPTLFAGVINAAAALAAKPGPQPQRYQVCLIMTDGMVMDLHDTLKSIVSPPCRAASEQRHQALLRRPAGPEQALLPCVPSCFEAFVPIHVASTRAARPS
jgi:hypothetical protein